MDLVGILDRKWIKVELDARTKREAIEELIDLQISAELPLVTTVRDAVTKKSGR